MKKYLYLSFLLIAIVGCDSNPGSSETEGQDVPVVINNLVGTWNWTETIDSLNQVVDKATADNSMSIVISDDYSIKQYRNGILSLDDKFNLAKTVFPNNTDTLTYLDWQASKYFNYIVYSLKSNSLVFGISNAAKPNKSIYTRGK